MATYNKNNEIRPMQSINVLVSGKTDTELLNALLLCITDNDNDLLSSLRDKANSTYNDKTRANIEVLAAIVDYCLERAKSSVGLVVE